MTNRHISLMFLELVFVAILTWRFTYVASMEVIGKTQTCDNEGEQVHLDQIDKQRCYVCVCRNGYVECERNPVCAEINGCHMLIEKTQERCCAKCKGCYFNGTYYESGEEWIAKDDPCTSLHCSAGIVTRSKLHCHVPCDNPDDPAPGKCCPTCADCKINGYSAFDDRDVTPGDLCVKCRCTEGSLTCLKKSCPVLHCPENEQVTHAGECCPSCLGNRSVPMELMQTCILGTKFYSERQTIAIDQCTRCTCMNQTNICERENCPPLECSPHLQRKKLGDCCKECVPDEDEDTVAAMQTRCHFNGHTYEDDQSWDLEACTKCTCIGGKIICSKTTCNESLSCPIGSHLVHQKGECCKKCVENKMEATCVAFGDPHYRTFDGIMYRFQGLGKYQFASDCHNHSFSVRVTNDFRSRTKLSTMTKRVRIKYGDSRVNLGQNCRVKLNGQRLTNSVNDGKAINIVMDMFDIKVTLNDSIKILWNCQSYLEVTVPIQYKNKMCGLCGNFNFNVKDDLKPRKSGVVVSKSNIMQFGDSWCVGKECVKNIKRTHQIRPCKVRTKHNACLILTSTDLFGTCHKKLSFDRYYYACVEDMCDCPSGKCYCDSLTAYAQECKRLGVEIANWRSNSYCANATNAVRVSHKKRKPPPIKYSKDDISRLLVAFRNKSEKQGDAPMIH